MADQEAILLADGENRVNDKSPSRIISIAVTRYLISYSPAGRLSAPWIQILAPYAVHVGGHKTRRKCENPVIIILRNQGKEDRQLLSIRDQIRGFNKQMDQYPCSPCGPAVNWQLHDPGYPGAMCFWRGLWLIKRMSLLVSPQSHITIQGMEDHTRTCRITQCGMTESFAFERGKRWCKFGKKSEQPSASGIKSDLRRTYPCCHNYYFIFIFLKPVHSVILCPVWNLTLPVSRLPHN